MKFSWTSVAAPMAVRVSSSLCREAKRRAKTTIVQGMQLAKIFETRETVLNLSETTFAVFHSTEGKVSGLPRYCG